MTAIDTDAASVSFVASFAREAKLSRIWRTIRFANQLLLVRSSAYAYLEILTKGVEALMVLSYFEEV